MLEKVQKVEKRRSASSGFEIIFPCEDSDKYNALILPTSLPGQFSLLIKSTDPHEETIASQARKESIQKQQEEKERKEQESRKK